MTGGSRGIGLAVLGKLLRCEMTVLLGVRQPNESRKAVEQSLGLELTRGRVLYEKCDTGDMQSIRDFALIVQQKYQAIHVLINNGNSEKSVERLSNVEY